MEEATRFIGIRHRVKTTAEGEAHPTQVVILEGDEVETLELPDEQAEFDYALGEFPVEVRRVEPGDNLSGFKPHHIMWRRVKADESVEGLPETHLRRDGKLVYRVHRVPAAYGGLSPGDRVGMVLGGSGNYFAFALARRAREIDVEVLRIPPFVLARERSGERGEDARTLALLVRERAALFFPVTDRDLALIRVREAHRDRIDAMKGRIACEQRLRQHTIGQVFCSPEGGYPEGGLEKAHDARRASDRILTALLAEEGARERELAKALGALDLYTELLEPIEGVGPALAAPIIAAVIDIRRFPTVAKFKTFCGCHVLEDGRFPRRRRGEVANWHPDIRQALFLLGDQWNRRPDSRWGKKLRHWKTVLRERHPEPVEVDGVLKYTNGHIHKMALWRTRTKFTEWLYRAWWGFERSGRIARDEAQAA
ncbi:transposase [Candidatus Wolfebacteria bacterium]|nr:transposase [Candidatus Wolfebacteria bacterium]